MATDLDGTLIGSANEFPLYTDFRDRLETLRDKEGLIWVACTGRRLRSFRRFFSPMRMMGLAPDFVVVKHAYIYSLTSLGYLPHVFWNLRILFRMWISRLSVKDAIDEWHQMITGVASGVSTVRQRRDRLCLRFDSEASAAVAAGLLREKVKRHQHLQVFHYLMEVDVRSIPFTKGLAVSELADHMKIPREQILAIGNGHNDISMLDGTTAAMTGCPANSKPELMEVVHKAQGHVARTRSLSGVMEIIDAHVNDTVDSTLPDWWTHPSQSYNPRQGRTNRRRRSRRASMATRRIVVILGITLILVFARFGLIPFSGVINAPIDWVIARLVRLFYAVF